MIGGWGRGVCVCCSRVGLLLVLAACSDDVAIEPGANLYLRLRATNYAGQSDAVSASGPL